MNTQPPTDSSEQKSYRNTGGFRDHIGTVKEDGKRNWIYAKKPKGKFYQYRTYVSWFLLALFFIGPFLRAGGRPLFLFNIIERRFIVFGVPFWTQDFHLFVLAFITFVVFIILFTVVFGRVWCGWACPQTLFMEMVFRKIEYWIEGDAHKQRQLDKKPWKGEKLRKRLLKWSVFAVLAYIIGNWALMYIVGTEEWMDLVRSGPAGRPGLFTTIIGFSFIFFGVFAYFREQACIVVCPYGRLQSVLLTRDSMLVAYDHERGEPRGKKKKGVDQSELGDCVDCHLCVQVCPTGIDIRDGTQMECVNCTACIDACHGIMEKLERPTGLIRITSEQQLESGKGFHASPRIYAYSVLLLLLVGVTSFAMTKGRNDVEATILRQPGSLYKTLDDGRIDNLYNYQIVNKTMKPMDLDIRMVEPEGELLMVGADPIPIEPQGVVKGAFFVILEKDQLKDGTTKIRLEVSRNDTIVDRRKINFLGPVILRR